MSSKIFSGALIVVSMRWSDRLIGVISTLVLARLLVPDDFGVVAWPPCLPGWLMCCSISVWSLP